jgi:acetyltransferase-like isoleucine patch superfamily enzyme
MNNSQNKYTFNHFWQKTKIWIWPIVNLVFFRNSLFRIQTIQTSLLQWFGAKLNRDVQLGYGCDIKHPWNLSFGKQVSIGNFVKLDCLNKICLEANVYIGNRAMLRTSDNKLINIENAITIKDQTIIEDCTTIYPGVIAYSSSLLKAGSIAHKDLAPGTIYSGTPAQFIAQNTRQIIVSSQPKPKNGLFLPFSALIGPVIE